MNEWTKIILTRHGQTASNAEERIMGWLDEELNQTGKEQAERLGKRLSNWKIDLFFSSPLSRALQTCEAIVQYHNTQLKIIEDLGEIRITLWEGLSWREVAERYPQEWEIWRKNPVLLDIKGVESLARLRKRIGGVLNNLIEANKGKTILITSHDAVTRMAILYLVGIDNKLYRRFPVDNASVSIVRVRNSASQLLLFNDISHIEGENLS